MSSQDKHITPWSPSDVQKYLKGELSAREMHQMERAALEDPFLADAIEGLSQRPTAPLAKDLDELRSRLDARMHEKKRRPIAWMKMAAAIVLLLGLGFTAWYVLVDNPKATLAKSEPQHNLPAAAPSEPPQRNAASADTAATLPLAKTNPVIAETPRTKAITPSVHKANTHAADSETLAYTGAEKARPASDSLDILLKNEVSSLDITPEQAHQYLVYNGQILDRNNRPLAGASLLVSGPSNAVTTTNALGQFKLNLRPQDTAQHLTVALVGYQNAYMAVNKLNADDAIGNTIFLKENPNALSEVVVTGEGRYRSESFATAPFQDKTEKLDSFWVKVTPVTGRLAYLDYLQSTKRSLPVDTTIQGAEIVSFGIDPKGAPTDFKIEHSLSPAHDAGIIRLITEGARWKILHGKNVRAMVHVSFP